MGDLVSGVFGIRTARFHFEWRDRRAKSRWADQTHRWKKKLCRSNRAMGFDAFHKRSTAFFFKNLTPDLLHHGELSADPRMTGFTHILGNKRSAT